MTYAKKLCGMEMGSTSFESPVGVDQAMRKKILKNGLDCALPWVGGNVTHRGGGKRFERMGRRNTLPERTTYVGPLVVVNQSHKSVIGNSSNCVKVL